MAQPRRNLSVELRVVNFNDPHPTRNFILRSPTYAIRIGRGSKSGNRELCPASYNAWFDSRVMSREHAVLKADPDTRCVYIEDVGSMHGTYVEDRRVTARERHRLYDDDLVKFGNEVTRGPESFPPLHVLVRYSWVDDSFGRAQVTPKKSVVELPPNTFQVPDYDDEDDEEDDDISFVQETVLKPKLEVVLPHPRVDPENSVQPFIEDPTSEEPGQGMHSTPSNLKAPPPSFASSPMRSQYDGLVHLSSPTLQMSDAAAGPSGLSEAERQADKRAMNLGEHTTSSLGSEVSTDMESPAKSSSSVPTGSQTKESDESSRSKLNVFVTHQISTQPTGAMKRTIIVDEDLTQSESGSDDPNSPDLMVDDSEDEQRHDALTDYCSDSDEEALLIAENHATKSARIEEDSTDSESSRSDVSDDIGMERDEDIFDHFENKVSGTKQPLLNNALNDYDKAPTQHEQVPYNMRPGNFTMHATRLSLPPNSMNRAPSPSDAAMAKSSDFASSGAGMAAGPYPYINPTPWSNPMASAYSSSWPYTFDGRPHAPYDDRYGGFQYSYGGSCAPGKTTSDSLRLYQSQLSFLPDRSFDSDGNGTMQADRPGGTEKPQTQSQPPPISISKPPNNGSPKVAHLTQSVPKSVANVSINSIVEPVSEEPLSSQLDNKLKRKADDTAGGRLAELTYESSKQVTQAGQIQPSICPPPSKTISVAQIKALQTVPSAGGSEEERPAKRARTDNGPGQTSFATLAATALAGAVVGGVGVVAALVSLPQDFFV